MKKDPEILNKREKEILQIILDRQIDKPARLDVDSFRFEFLDDREILDKFSAIQLIKRNSDQTRYKLSLVGLYLAGSDLSIKVLNDIDIICDVLREQYKTKLKQPISIEQIQRILDIDKIYLVSCMELLCDEIPLGETPDLMANDANLTPTERLFDFKHFADIPRSYLPAWFPKKYTQQIKKPGNREANASNREQILGSGFAVTNKFPDKCKWGGKTVGKRTYEQISEHASTWWDEGVPPLSDETSIDLLNNWLKTLE